MEEARTASVPESGPTGEDVTGLLRRARDGSRDAVEALFPLVQDALHARAVRLLAGRHDGMRWEPTAIVSEVFLKLVDQRAADWRDRHHFQRVAAIAMRRIVVDWARAELRQKRGAGRIVELPPELSAAGLSVEQVAELDEVLDRLAVEHERSARVVELRFFGGLSVVETADVLGVSPRTVDGDWQFARTWLHDRLVG